MRCKSYIRSVSTSRSGEHFLRGYTTFFYHNTKSSHNQERLENNNTAQKSRSCLTQFSSPAIIKQRLELIKCAIFLANKSVSSRQYTAVCFGAPLAGRLPFLFPHGGFMCFERSRQSVHLFGGFLCAKNSWGCILHAGPAVSAKEHKADGGGANGTN